MESVCVFCGANPGRGNLYLREAVRLGELLAGQGVTVVYGGAGIGVMGELARAAMRAGGKVVGVIPGHLVEVEQAPADLHELHRVHTMHERKALMAELSEGFVALPGGLGTLEGIAEVASWSQPRPALGRTRLADPSAINARLALGRRAQMVRPAPA